jgi:hypothetical protein
MCFGCKSKVLGDNSTLSLLKMGVEKYFSADKKNAADKAA